MKLPKDKLWQVDFYQIEYDQRVAINTYEDHIVIHWKRQRRFSNPLLKWWTHQPESSTFKFRKILISKNDNNTYTFQSRDGFYNLKEQLQNHINNKFS